MLNPPSGQEVPLRVVGIDPGTETLGFTVLDLYLSSKRKVVQACFTVETTPMLRDYKVELATHNTRTARLMALEDRLFILFEQFQPNVVAAETPFLSRFPQAFAALTECYSYIRRAVHRYDRYMPLEGIDPPTAKKGVGVLVKRGVTKDDVAKAIGKLTDLEFAEGISLEGLDEHSVDSIAVAYTIGSELLNHY